MGTWIELGLFCLVLVFALHQFHDLKKEKQKRGRREERHCHLHLIPGRKGDVEKPKGGVRHVKSNKGHYEEKK
jgi:diadenosine tetraphosphate (Ap4A) HIT family hydrolase